MCVRMALVSCVFLLFAGFDLVWFWCGVVWVCLGWVWIGFCLVWYRAVSFGCFYSCVRREFCVVFGVVCGVGSQAARAVDRVVGRGAARCEPEGATGGHGTARQRQASCPLVSVRAGSGCNGRVHSLCSFHLRVQQHLWNHACLPARAVGFRNRKNQAFHTHSSSMETRHGIVANQSMCSHLRTC